MGMIKEFKDFAVKGNMVDMAVGIIIGAAFGTVVKSLVDGILMPLISSITGSPDFSNLYVPLKSPEGAEAATSLAEFMEAGGVALAYGQFINDLIAFLLVGIALFFIVKGMNKMKKEEEPAPAPEPAGPSAEDLLTEIRDLLAKQ